MSKKQNEENLSESYSKNYQTLSALLDERALTPSCEGVPVELRSIKSRYLVAVRDTNTLSEAE